MKVRDQILVLVGRGHLLDRHAVEALGVGDKRAGQLLTELHRAGLVAIVEWQRLPTRQQWRPVYGDARGGQVTDVPSPAPPADPAGVAKRKRRKARAAKAPLGEGVSSLWAAVVGAQAPIGRQKPARVHRLIGD